MHVTRAYYNARGLVDSTVVFGPYGGGNAKTSVTWHNAWNLPVTTTDPNGIVSTRTYDPANGNLLTERVGSDVARTTSYGYDADTKLLRTVSTPGISVPDSLFYDDELKNVRKSRSAAGTVSIAYKDRLGRDTLTIGSVDVVTDTVTKIQRRRLLYDAMGRVKDLKTSGPAMPYTITSGSSTLPTDTAAVAAETLFVKTTYDREGRVLTVNTYSLPNYGVEFECELHCQGVPAGTVGSWDARTYDYLGRPLTQRLGGGPLMVTYDPAGNVVSEVARTGKIITSTHDASSRLVKRIVPPVNYTQEFCDAFANGMLYATVPTPFCFMKFPLYPTASGTGLTVTGDTVRFVFDASGRMIRADNKDARVARTYFLNGALRTETTTLREFATSQFTTSFTNTYGYDIGGRRVSHAPPTIQSQNDGTITYAYDSDIGTLTEVAQGTTRLRFKYDLAGRQDTMRVHKVVGAADTLGVVERRRYDYDGRLIRLERQRRDTTGFLVGLLTDSLIYDARGKIRQANIQSASADVGIQTVKNHYSGLGTLVASEKANTLGAEAEQFRATAMGTVWRSRSDVSGPNNHYPLVSFYGFDGDLKGKQPVLPSPDPLYTDTVYVETDEDGNTLRSGAVFQRSQTTGDRYYTATRNYYTGDSRMAVVQKYHAFDGGRSGAWEEFRYDAMGRKIMSVTRRGGAYPYTICSVTSSNLYCPEWVERTVWDGDQVLYELRGGLNETPTSTGLFWGRVGYVHAGGIDKPLVLMSGRVPTYNWRGLPESSVWTNGRKADCSLIYSGCPTIAWPSQNSVYLKSNPFVGGGVTPQWIGTLVMDGAGSTGMLYRRNRYYDPTTGQFTQQDPIGIAGGANVYGFADGDPVNFADPFGLCPPRDTNTSDCTVRLNGATLSNAAFRESLEKFARFVGRDIELNGPKSGDRTSAQNASVSVAKASPHLENVAADIHVPGMSDNALAHKAVESGLFNGVEQSLGVPSRGENPHVHVDNAKQKRVWTQNRDGSTTPGLPPKQP